MQSLELVGCRLDLLLELSNSFVKGGQFVSILNLVVDLLLAESVNAVLYFIDPGLQALCFVLVESFLILLDYVLPHSNELLPLSDIFVPLLLKILE